MEFNVPTAWCYNAVVTEVLRLVKNSISVSARTSERHLVITAGNRVVAVAGSATNYYVYIQEPHENYPAEFSGVDRCTRAAAAIIRRLSPYATPERLGRFVPKPLLLAPF